MDDGYVLVIGSSGIDVKARPEGKLEWGTPILGHVRNSIGGVARNIAENLARLEIDTILLTAVGQDDEGKRVIAKCESVGIDCSHVLYVEGGRTGTFLAILKEDGEFDVAISDFEIIDQIDRAYILEHEELFEDATLIVIDATLSDDALSTVFELARRYEKRVCADPTTPDLAGRLCEYLMQLYLVVPNAAETQALCGVEAAYNRDSAMEVARTLVTLGAEIAVVTMGDVGIAYADSSGGGFIRAIKTDVVDSTGAGDAFSGAVIFGLLNEVPVDEAMRLGVTAASLTLKSRETVLPNLNQELLYGELMA